MATPEHHPPAPSSPKLWRRVAASAWADPSNPVVYAKVQVDMTDISARLREYSKSTGVKVTITSLVSWALAKAISENPDCNAVVRGGELKQLSTVSLNVGVASPDADTVSPSLLPNANKLTVLDIATKIAKEKDVIYKKQSEAVNKYSVSDWLMPASIVRFVFNTFTALETDWGISLAWAGLNNANFQPASATITCIHRYGLEEAFSTFPHMHPTPLMLSVGAVTERPWVVKGKVEARHVLTLCFTIDTRVLDGKLGGKLMKDTKHFIESWTPESDQKAKL